MREAELSTQWTPFADRLDRNALIESGLHDEALARLHYLVESRRKVGLLLGQSGTGKSLLLKVFANELRRQKHVVVKVNLLGLNEYEFVWALAAGLGTSPRGNAPLFSLWRAVVDRLIEHRYQQLNTTIILDDAGEAERDVVTCAVRLLSLDLAPETQLTMVVATSPEKTARLGPRLLEQCQLRIELDCWEPRETAEYLQRRIQSATTELPAFHESATSRIHELTAGNPRLINELAHLSLLANAADQKDRIDADTVDSVYQELSVASHR